MGQDGLADSGGAPLQFHRVLEIDAVQLTLDLRAQVCVGEELRVGLRPDDETGRHREPGGDQAGEVGALASYVPGVCRCVIGEQEQLWHRNRPPVAERGEWWSG